ncbi:hypothetical protein OUZ56_012312 [Daphnia magna]|uniref:Uncharacterized protein n=1 Tax=Daphnia magna TaxID=35525 RepID=A0ABQ9Z3X9_9CRUS|nr:hypothetical protein OUZ56_012312 [Daphnia magna]
MGKVTAAVWCLKSSYKFSKVENLRKIKPFLTVLSQNRLYFWLQGPQIGDQLKVTAIISVLVPVDDIPPWNKVEHFLSRWWSEFLQFVDVASMYK